MKSVWHNNTFQFHADILMTYRWLFSGKTDKSMKCCQLWIILSEVLLHLLRLYAQLLLAGLFSTMAVPILAMCRTQAKGSFWDVIAVSRRSGRDTLRYAGWSCICLQSIPTSALDSDSAYSFQWCLWSHPREFPNKRNKIKMKNNGKHFVTIFRLTLSSGAYRLGISPMLSRLLMSSRNLSSTIYESETKNTELTSLSTISLSISRIKSSQFSFPKSLSTSTSNMLKFCMYVASLVSVWLPAPPKVMSNPWLKGLEMILLILQSIAMASSKRMILIFFFI